MYSICLVDQNRHTPLLQVRAYIIYILGNLYARNAHSCVQFPFGDAVLLLSIGEGCLLPAGPYFAAIIIVRVNAKFDARGEYTGCHQFGGGICVPNVWRCNVVQVKNET